MNYQDIKSKFEENKQKIVLVICFMLVFVIGFGTGRFEAANKQGQATYKDQANYNIKTGGQATKQATGEGTAEAAAEVKDQAQNIQPAVLGAAADKQCPVKGNRNSKIYHMPGGAFYATLKSPQCFQTEADAKTAGYRRSGR